MKTLIIIQGSKLKTYHEFDNIEKFINHVNNWLRKENLRTVILILCEKL